jgi:hypothetical protein
MANRFVLPGQQVVDANGNPYSGAKLYFYESGTSTPQDTYSDSDLSTPNTNPVVADSAGRFSNIFLAEAAYKVILKTAGDVTVATWDPVEGPAGASEATQNEVDARTATDIYVSPDKLAEGLGLQGTSIASAETLTLPDVGDYFTVTGTTAVAAISSRVAGRKIWLRFAAATQLTHHATDLILGSNITTVAGDVAEFTSEGSGDWRLTGYIRASGAALAVDINGLTEETTPVGTADYGIIYDASASTNKKVPLRRLKGVAGALVKKTAVQAIANDTATALTWASEDYDTDSIHDNSSNTSRLTVPNGVTKVRVSASIQWDSNTTGIRQITFHKNGSVFQGSLTEVTVAATNPTGLLSAQSAIVTVTAGDYFEAIAYQNSGGSLNTGGVDSRVWFAMEILE